MQRAAHQRHDVLLVSDAEQGHERPRVEWGREEVQLKHNGRHVFVESPRESATLGVGGAACGGRARAGGRGVEVADTAVLRVNGRHFFSVGDAGCEVGHVGNFSVVDTLAFLGLGCLFDLNPNADI